MHEAALLQSTTFPKKKGEISIQTHPLRLLFAAFANKHAYPSYIKIFDFPFVEKR